MGVRWAHWVIQEPVRKYTSIIIAAEIPTNVPASIKDNSLCAIADWIRCKDQDTRATSIMRIVTSISYVL